MFLWISCEHTFIHVWSRGKRLVISLSYHTNISFIVNPLSYNTIYLSWLSTSYSYPPFIMSMWSYQWQSRYPFALVPLWEWTYSSPWHTFRIMLQLLLWKVEHMFRRKSPTFSFVTFDNEWISLSLEMVFGFWWTLSLFTQFTQIWCNEHQRWQHM